MRNQEIFNGLKAGRTIPGLGELFVNSNQVRWMIKNAVQGNRRIEKLVRRMAQK